MDRRSFVIRGTSLALATCLHGLPALAFRSTKPTSSTPQNLIPAKPCIAPNYWCTWAVQNYMYGHHLGELRPELLEGASGSRLAHDALSEQALFGKDGWAEQFFPRVRQDLYLLLDDGWESGGTATFELDPQKFSSFTGAPDRRLSGLNSAIRKVNWRAAALWCRNTPGGKRDEQLEKLSETAGIEYWKIDIGDPAFHLIDLRQRNHTHLLLEHVHGESPVNGDWRRDGRFGVQMRNSRRQRILANTDVYRTYDVTSALSLPTTLDRLAEMLKGAEGHGRGALLNVEDEVYVAAVMGCTMGVLRHPLEGLRPGSDTDLFLNGARRAKRRMDEVVRALRWQRLAPPFPAGSGTVRVSAEVLTDSWTFQRGQTWQNDLVGQTVHQGAPACISINLPLPRVTSRGEKPFIFASRFPNGAVAIGAHERTRPDRAWYMPEAEVQVHIGDAPGPYGIFGSVSRLTLVFDRPLRGSRVLTQDLAGDVAEDVTDHVMIDGRSLLLTEANLRDFGLRAATADDLSSPGFVLALR
jgi:hypothetical protein